MPKAIRVYEHGGAEVLKWEEVELPPVGAHDVRVRHTAIGVNYSDIYRRTGLYSNALPSGMGSEAAGVVEQVGRRVRDFKRGDRVGYVVNSPPGAYATERVLSAEALVKVPAGIGDEQAAAVLLRGLTCWYLLRRTHRLSRGDNLLITAAAGGVGLILCQWARALGAHVIGAVGSEAKASLARRHGCHRVVVGYHDLAAQVRKLTRGKGVDVVYDSVGKDTFHGSLDSLRARGLMVSFGNASGPVPPFAALELSDRGSLFLTRPRLVDYIDTPEVRRTAVRELFSLMKRRQVRLHIGQRYALADAARAQRDLEARRTTGSTVLVP
ncbi:MAG TPA: quinone oxidoreductase [Steroidobacteraceae bacterium]|jgi:NADPH2:quinone reductase|nr:quinone oxidoreductase [Steroidobacteraceae bacterium]